MNEKPFTKACRVIHEIAPMLETETIEIGRPFEVLDAIKFPNPRRHPMDEKHLIYLDTLRESGVTNMFGAAPYLREMFPDLSKTEARDILLHWMKTFIERHPR